MGVRPVAADLEVHQLSSPKADSFSAALTSMFPVSSDWVTPGRAAIARRVSAAPRRGVALGRDLLAQRLQGGPQLVEDPLHMSVAVGDALGLQQRDRDRVIRAPGHRQLGDVGLAAEGGAERVAERVASAARGVDQRPVDVPEHQLHDGQATFRHVLDRLTLPPRLVAQIVDDLHRLAESLPRLVEAASTLPRVEDELTAGVTSLQTDVRKVHEGVVPLNENVTDLDETAEALEKSIAALRDQITVLTGEIQGFRGDIAELRDKIPGL